MDPHDLGLVIDWKDDAEGLVIGTKNYKTGDHPHLLGEIGVVHTENGKLADKTWERWRIDCSNGLDSRKRVECELSGISVSSLLSLPTTGPFIRTTKASTYDGTIRNLRMDWDNGQLDFSVKEETGLFTDETSDTQVQIRFRWKSSLAYLVSLRATGWERSADLSTGGKTSTLTTFEYSVPEYSYALNVPMVFQGMHSAGVHAWRDMEQTLTQHDREVWTSVAKQREEFSPPEGAALARRKAKFGDVPTEKLTVEQQKRLDQDYKDLMIETFSQRLSRTEMSAAGRDKILDYLKSNF